MPPSPLFASVLWQGDHFKILDETLLPWKTEYITVHEIPQALEAVKEMKTRAFGQVLTFLYSLALAAKNHAAKDRESLDERLIQLGDEFSRVRPTFDFQGLYRRFCAGLGEPPADEEVGSWVETKAHEWIARIIKAREKRARRTAELLPNPCRLMTHCNVSGELVAVAQYCEELGKEIEVCATETRPYLQGTRLTAWELHQAGVKVALIPDCAIGQVMAQGRVNAVLVGADRCARNGDVINKVGTYPLALVAKEYRIPFYALVQDPGSLVRGEDVQIEERPVAELLTFQGRPLIPEGLKGIEGRYPAFDVTPAGLISSLITFDETFTPETFQQRFKAASPVPQEGKKEQGRLLLIYGVPRPESYPYLSYSGKTAETQALLVPEMRPHLWGAQVVAGELLRRQIPMTLISDNMMGSFFARGEIRRLCLFYSELGPKGPVGICGSLLAVLLARAHRVPIELLSAGESDRPPLDRDVSTFLGQQVSPEGVATYPVEREVIPWALFKNASDA